MSVHKFLITGFLISQSLFYSCTNGGKQEEVKIVKTDFPVNADTVYQSNCHQIILEALISSKRCKEITNGLNDRIAKNGGTSYGFILEGSPNPRQDSAVAYSTTYDFSLHEIYPDHDPVIARFTFDRTKEQLYEVDVVSDSLIPIEFDKLRYSNLMHLCK